VIGCALTQAHHYSAGLNLRNDVVMMSRSYRVESINQLLRNFMDVITRIGLTILVISSVIIITGLIFRLSNIFQLVTIYDYQRGLKYYKGKFQGLLQPGQYWVYRTTTTVITVDMRSKFETIAGQEVLSSDGVTLKISLAAKYLIEDPHIAINKEADYHQAFYLILQLALREVIGSTKIDELLIQRDQIGEKLEQICVPKATEIGLKLALVNIKDIMFPGDLKKIFTQVVKAQKEGQAILERARGETAALRNLANAAKLIENNPALMQLRILQQMSESNGNTYVLGLPTNTPIPIEKRSYPEDRKPITSETENENENE
jgi:regulator of protease activity HflC (stomatin/prohibitin superfamily)